MADLIWDLGSAGAPPVEVGDRIVIQQVRSVPLRALADPQLVAESIAQDTVDELSRVHGIETLELPQLFGELAPTRGYWTGSGNAFIVHIELRVIQLTGAQHQQQAASVYAAVFAVLAAVALGVTLGYVLEQSAELVKATKLPGDGESPFDALSGAAVAAVLVAGLVLAGKLAR